MTTHQHIKIGKLTALISFLTGTCIFAFYFLSSWDVFLFAGYFFIILAVLINIGILISLFVKVGKDKDNRKSLFITGGLMLLNVPVMFLYCWITLLLLNTMRITFTNSTRSDLTNVYITGCGNALINDLKAWESKTVWFNIDSDGPIVIDYLYNGQQTKAFVAGYVTNNMGQKMKYNIGGKNSLKF